MKRHITTAAVAMALCAGGVSAQQNFPNKAIRIFVGPVGSGTDIEARLIAQGIAESLGQPVIVDNRSAIQASEAMSKAPPDGYSLNLAAANLWIGALLQKTPYDPVKDFAPVTMVSRDANILVVHPSLPVKSVRELIALAKARPGALNYGSGSSGSPTHLSAELFKSMVHVDMVRISYKSGGPAMVDLLGGHVHLMFATAPTATPHVKSGRLRALAVTSATPSALAPELPTVAASGVPGYELTALNGMFVPAKTPVVIINRLNQDIVRYLRTADAREKFLATGIEIVDSTPEALAAAIKADLATTGKLIRDAGIQAD